MNWFKHDTDCLEDDRFSALVDEYKSNGYAVFFMIVEELYRNEGKPVGSLVLKKIARRLGLAKEEVVKIADFASSDDCESLLVKQGNAYTSERVSKELKESEDIRKKKKEGINRRWEAYRKAMAEAKEKDAGAIDMKRTSNRGEIDIYKTSNSDEIDHLYRLESFNLDSPFQGNVLSNTKKKPTIPKGKVGTKESPSDLPADNGFSLTLKSGELWPIPDLFHVSMQKAFPKVDATAEFWKMVAKTTADPKSRPTLSTVVGFVRNWLSNAARDAENEESREEGRRMITDPNERNRGVNPDGTYTI